MILIDTVPGDVGDQEFEPSAEMLVHDFDDEQTLAEEEAMAIAGGEDPENELNSLQKVSFSLFSATVWTNVAIVSKVCFSGGRIYVFVAEIKKCIQNAFNLCIS